jgi:hypothetical protein
MGKIVTVFFGICTIWQRGYSTMKYIVHLCFMRDPYCMFFVDVSIEK